MLYVDEKFTIEPEWHICVSPNLCSVANVFMCVFCYCGVQAQFTAIMGPLLQP